MPRSPEDRVVKSKLFLCSGHSVLPSLGSGGGGMIFVSSARQVGQLLNLKSQGGDTFRGEDDFRQSSRGELLYHDELLVFPQNASS